MTSAVFEAVMTDLLRDGYSVRFVATGDSMDPTIHDGEHLHVAAVAGDELQRGEVVLVRAARGLTAHRIVSIDAQQIVTRGDNALRSDPPLPLDAVIGRVAGIERGGNVVAVDHAPRRWPSILRLMKRRLL